jgi:hypothetical protein
MLRNINIPVEKLKIYYEFLRRLMGIYKMTAFEKVDEEGLKVNKYYIYILKILERD